MKPCTDFKETLWLDVLGELPAGDREAWESHLGTCRACRRERERLARMLQDVKAALPAPSLTEHGSDRILRAIRSRRTGQGKKTGDRRWYGLVLGRPVHALAVVSLLFVISLAWYGLREFYPRSPGPPAVSGPGAEEPLLARDFEVIQNLDLLEELDDLQKLIQVMDDRGVDSETSPNGGMSSKRGLRWSKGQRPC